MNRRVFRAVLNAVVEYIPLLMSTEHPQASHRQRWSFVSACGQSSACKHDFCLPLLLVSTPQWGAADAEIKVPSGENTELKRSPFKAWSKSVYRYTCYAYCQGFLSCLFLHFRSIHLHFFQNLSRFFPVFCLWLTHGSCVGPQNKIGHPAGCRFPC